MKTQENLETIDMKGMGRRIRTQREAMHLTRAELAGRLDVSSKFVGDIECGEKGVSIQTLYKLSQILNLTADYILAGDKKARKHVDPEVERLKENILGPLSTCSTAQLKCMEQIARFYVEGIVSEE